MLLLSFIAGVLTVLAPCTLPLLPIIIGGSVRGDAHSRIRPLIIALSLSMSIVVFTLLLKASTLFIEIPATFWSYISGSIVMLLGIITVFPTLWEKFALKFSFSRKSNELLVESAKKKTYWGEILTGASLGPVFSSCSPTYFLILATVLPESLARGVVYLLAYALGLSLVLLLVAYLGQKFVRKIAWAADPSGWFKRGLGILFIVVGIFIFTGLDKKLQTYLIEHGLFDITQVEQRLLQKNTEPADMERAMEQAQKTPSYPMYREIQNPSGFVNTKSLTLSEFVGKKVILLDFMTYSCINCIRTFPYLNSWYEKYQDEGLVIIGIHTPEFAFEHRIENVEKAMTDFGIKFPVVLDNDYSTWRAYGNNYWPRKYLIDINGNIVYDHIGEGDYDVTEKKIQELLEERKVLLKEPMEITAELTTPVEKESISLQRVGSPEIYFGSNRNRWLSNGRIVSDVSQNFVLPTDFGLNKLYLDGSWTLSPEHAENQSAGAKIIFRYQANQVFFVARSADPVDLRILVDDKFVHTITVNEDRLYTLVDETQVPPGEHVLTIEVESAGLEAYTFTFG